MDPLVLSSADLTFSFKPTWPHGASVALADSACFQ